MQLEPFIAVFSGTAVEFFETVVISYALIRAGYFRETLVAVVLGHLAVFVMAVFLAPTFHLIPVDLLRALAVLMLTAMGVYWFAKSLRLMRRSQRPQWASDPLAAVGVAPGVEAAEIAIIALPVYSATLALWEVLLGVALGIVAVSVVATLLHRRLMAIPEVKVKLVVGMILTFLGVSWLVELAASPEVLAFTGGMGSD